MNVLSARIHKIFFIFLFTLLSTSFFLYANEPENWIVAVSQFDSNVEDDALSTVIPLYILQNLPSSMSRSVSHEEQFRHDEQKINTELRKEYEELQKKQLERDSLIITHQYDESFTEIQEQRQSEIKKSIQNIHNFEQEKALLLQKEYLILEKMVIPWDNNRESLYTVPQEMDFFNPSDIQALVSGKIHHAEGFISVTVYITVYPGRVVEMEITEVDNILSIQSLSKRISEQVYTTLSKKQEVEIEFTVEPQEAREQSIIHINGQLVKFQNGLSPTRIILPSGLYEFYVESPGYEGLAVTYSFTNQAKFNVAVSLKQKNTQSVEALIPTPKGTVFLNTQKLLQESETNTAIASEKTTGLTTINGFPALGEFVSEDGVSTWFLLNDGNMHTNTGATEIAQFSVEPNKKNIGEIIETNRKRMYNSYAALIVSLPLYFIANGQYLNEYNSWASGKSSGDNIDGWETARNITMGTSIGLGVNFLVQLGLYIYSANAILPEEVTTTQ